MYGSSAFVRAARSLLRCACWRRPVHIRPLLWLSVVAFACSGTERAPNATLDGGPSTDAGESTDAGSVDGGLADAGPRDAGQLDAGDCDGGCGEFRACCDGTCVNPVNNPQHCGACGTVCSGSTPYCQETCQATPCSIGGCPNGATCCGASCCGAGEICCDSEGPVGGFAICFKPTAESPTCPSGCAPLCQSDREAKRDIVPVDDRTILQRVVGLPVSEWSYKADSPSVRHIGPMAQDFKAAFGVGATDRSYDPIDAHGVAFSSIRALYEMVQKQDARIERLERENTELRQKLEKGAR